MGISKKLLQKFNSLNPEAQKRLSRMCWSDKIEAKEISKEFSISANEINKFMRFYLTEKDFKRWMVRSSKRYNQRSKKAALNKINNI